MRSQEIKVGKTFKIDGRIFYPLVKVTHWKHNQEEFHCLSPLALVVIEGDMKYILPMKEFDDPEKLETLMDMIKV
ncbi:MAG: hypothetical protein KO316_00390 [Methanobacterium sp.]|jgi:hypothetical protein|nr:hypothetical protein [Methanobacterium sp.]